MPYTRKNSSQHNVPLRRSSPRLLARTRKEIPTSRLQAVSSSARHTKTAGKQVTVSRNKSTMESNNLRKNNQGREDSVGIDKQLPTKTGTITSGSHSLQKEFDKEQKSGSDTDSFVSTMVDLKDIGDSKGNDNEVSRMEGRGISNGKGADDDASGDDGEDDDLSSINFDMDDNREEPGGVELSPVLLVPTTRESIGLDRPTSDKRPPRNRVGNVGSSVAVSGRRTQRANNYTDKEDLLLTKAYVSVSNDPINGSQQRAHIFWAKVHEKYKVLVSQQVPNVGFAGRPVESLKQRYLKVIAKAVAKYNKFYRLLKNQNKSGWTQDDYIEEAARLYEEEEGKPFRFALCVEVLHQVPKFDPMVDQEELASRGKRVNNVALPQGATINRPIGSKKAKIVQYLKDSGVVVTDRNSSDNLSVSNKSATEDISRRLEKNYSQRERQMKLKRIDLYIKLGQMDKANALMKEVEDEEERMNRVEEESAPANNDEPITMGDRGRMPPLPPLNEVTVEDDQIVESQLTGTSI